MTHETETVRLTTAQALIRFLVNQYSERDGVEQRLVTGTFGIFGHGNVAGVAQALLQNELDPDADGGAMPFIMPRNEQGAVHAATAYAKTRNRMQTMAVTTSIGPGALNMVTGAATATTNRLPVLLLPSDQFANRKPDPVLQQIENPMTLATTVNDTFRTVSAYFDRIERPEQLIPSAIHAMQTLTDPANVGAVTIALPQDVQAEAYDWPVDFFKKRVWHVRRTPAEEAAVARAVALIRASKRPMIVAGGGVIYSGASDELRTFAAATGIPVADTQAGKGAINYDHPQSIGGVGSTGANSANHVAETADLVIGIGTRYSDFTTASHTQFKNPDVNFVNVNVLPFDAVKHGAEMLVSDAKATLTVLQQALYDYHVSNKYVQEYSAWKEEWNQEIEANYHRNNQPLPAQTEIFGALNEMMGDRGVLINAAGSMPGDLQALWRAKTPEQYHVEYAFSTMGYEIPAALGVKLAAPDSEVVAIVGDGAYQMLPMELATIVQEGLKVIIVLLQNYGFASIGALSESRGSQRYGTQYRKDGKTHRDEGTELRDVDLAMNARSWGFDVIEVSSVEAFKEAFREAEASPRSTLIHVETDLKGPSPDSISWWDVAVAEVSTLETTQQARLEHEENKKMQRYYL